MMSNYLRLIRYPNLLLIITTQVIVQYFIVLPGLAFAGQSPLLSDIQFILLICVTLIITIIGYVQNDIEDIEMDRINKPQKMVVGQYIAVEDAKRQVLLLTLLGSFIAVYVAVRIGQLQLALIFPLAVGLLVFYAKRLKKSFLIGNALVSLFVSGVAAVVWFAEREGLRKLLEKHPEKGQFFASIFLIYLIFAFLANFYREVVKDMQDYEGDKALGSSTLPIVMGQNVAKWFSVILATTLALLLTYLAFYLFKKEEIWGTYWIIVLILIPLLYSISILMFKPLQKSALKKVSSAIKLIMLSGLLLLIIVFN